MSTLTVNSPAWVKWNMNSVRSTKMAERKKLMYENKGYILKHEFVNVITGECTLTYETSKK